MPGANRSNPRRGESVYSPKHYEAGPDARTNLNPQIATASPASYGGPDLMLAHMNASMRGGMMSSDSLARD